MKKLLNNFDNNNLKNLIKYQIVDIILQAGVGRTKINSAFSFATLCNSLNTGSRSLICSSTFEENMINHPTFFVSTRVYDKIGFFDIKYPVSADYDFVLRIYHDDRFIMKYIEGECFSAHRFGGRESRKYWMKHNPFMWLKVLNDYYLIKYKYGHLGILKYSTVLASTKEFGGMTQTSPSTSIKLL